jgi:very-short-patch-repair endonuclease
MPNPLSADGPISRHIGVSHAHRRVDLAVAVAADRQHGVVSLAQLIELGLTVRAADKRVATGRLHRIHYGVYAVGRSQLSRNGRFMAAVFACGSDAVLSHRSAAELWGLCTDQRESIDVTAPGRRGRSPGGINAHRHGSLRPSDCTSVHGIPCTSVERTLLDFAGTAPIWELRKAVAEAEVLRILDHAAMRGLIRRSRGRRGVARLRLLLDELHPETKRTRSELERMFLRMCVAARLPRPEVNVSLDLGNGFLTPDFLWRDAGLIVEADSRRFHDTHSAFQHDRRREQRLQLAGWRVSRCTWEQVEREPRRLAETISGLLAQKNPRRRA